jgi:hypothetical protein
MADTQGQSRGWKDRLPHSGKPCLGSWPARDSQPSGIKHELLRETLGDKREPSVVFKDLGISLSSVT